MRLLTALLLGLCACTAQIRDDEAIASDALLLEHASAVTSQPLAFKPWSGPADENDAAVQAVRAGKLDEAELLFEQSIQTKPLFALAYINLARLYTISGEPERARVVYLRLAKEKGFTDAEIFASARKLYEFSRTAEGVGLMEALAETRPAAAVLTWLGSYRLGLADYAGADAAFDEALSLNRIDGEALFGRGYIRWLAGDANAAADFFGRAMTAGWKEPALCSLRLQALFRSNRLEEAEKEIPGCKVQNLETALVKARILLVLHPLRPQTIDLPEEDRKLLEQRLPGLGSVARPTASDLSLDY